MWRSWWWWWGSAIALHTIFYILYGREEKERDYGEPHFWAAIFVYASHQVTCRVFSSTTSHIAAFVFFFFSFLTAFTECQPGNGKGQRHDWIGRVWRTRQLKNENSSHSPVSNFCSPEEFFFFYFFFVRDRMKILSQGLVYNGRQSSINKRVRYVLLTHTHYMAYWSAESTYCLDTLDWRIAFEIVNAAKWLKSRKSNGEESQRIVARWPVVARRRLIERTRKKKRRIYVYSPERREYLKKKERCCRSRRVAWIERPKSFILFYFFFHPPEREIDEMAGLHTGAIDIEYI